jgi:hypothetical protein
LCPKWISGWYDLTGAAGEVPVNRPITDLIPTLFLA